jgi:hypothetical protein
MRLMDDTMIAAQFENLDRRLAGVEQILPSLATKNDLKTLATKEEIRLAIAALATKEELRIAIEPLATREELKALEVTLRREIREEGDRSRRHMDIITEAQRDDIRMLAEHLSAVISKLGDR